MKRKPRMLAAASILGLAAALACAPRFFEGSLEVSSAPVLQNEELSGVFDSEGQAASIDAQPSQGTLETSGLSWVYTANYDAVGSDSFDYSYTNPLGELVRRRVELPISAVPAGTVAHTETYAGGARGLTGWKSRSSTFGLGATRVFETETINGVASTNVLRMTVLGTVVDGMDTVPADSFYTDAGYGAAPRDGSGGLGPGQWPWAMELLHKTECINDVTITARVRDTTTGASNAIGYGLLMNYKLRGTGSAQTLTGYQVLDNAGGGTTTLSRFLGAGEHATDFMDQWPGHTCCGVIPNPVSLGPYKGWDYTIGVHTAGGNPDGGVKEKVLVGRYQYDGSIAQATVSWEVRPVTGVDSNPGVFSFTRVLTGTDAIAPGGDFGVFVVNMRGYNQGGTPGNHGVQISNVQLSCTN